MLLRVTRYGEPILRQKGEPITRFDDQLQELAQNMLTTMYENHGIGLAAQQVDHALMICVMDLSWDEDEIDFEYSLDGRRPPLDLVMPMVLCNPHVTVLDDKPEPFEEGCLSFPDMRGEVSRPARIRVVFQDLEGSEHTLEADGMLGRVIQHEVDHLNGVLFIDHMQARTLRSLDSKLKRLKRETRDYLRMQRSKKQQT